MKSLLTAIVLAFFFTSAHGQDNTIRILGPLEAIAGEDLMITCMIDSGAGDLTLREGGVVVGDRITEPVDGVNNTHKLFILTNTMISDNGRVFTCGVVEFNSPAMTVTIFFLQPPLFGDAPNFDGTTLTVTETTDVALPYSITANPTPPPVLTRNTGGLLNSERVVLQDSTSEILFRGVSRDDAGDYTLTFTNEAGSEFLTFTLIVLYPPTFNVVATNANCAMHPQSMVTLFCEVDIGTNVTLDCQFDSVPAGTLDQVYIPENASNVRVEDNSVIVFESVTEENFDDMYRCTASNEINGETFSVTLNIQLGLEAPTVMPTTAMPSTTVGQEMVTTEGAGNISPMCFLNMFTLLLIALLCHNI